MDVAAIVERLWPGVPARIDVLGGGITNHNFRVRLDDGGDYVLRLGGRDTELLGIDSRPSTSPRSSPSRSVSGRPS